MAGVRDSKTVDGVTYNYITQNGQVVRQTWGSHVMDFIYDNTGKPYAVKYDGTLYYYVLNLQGDVISIITHWGESYGSYTYDAWGNVLSVSGDIAKLNPIRYRGYYYDSETELYYLGSRYYDPVVKRFVNADGAAFATINPYSNGLTDKNYFAYCDNNPVSRSDDGGTFFNTVIGAVVGGLTGALSAALEGGSKREVFASAASGAVSGAIAGAGVDFAVATVATGGAAAVVGATAVAALTGAGGSIAGDITSNAIQRKPIKITSVNIKAAAVSAVANVASFGIGGFTGKALGDKFNKVKGIKAVWKTVVRSTRGLRNGVSTTISTYQTTMITTIQRLTTRLVTARRK